MITQLINEFHMPLEVIIVVSTYLVHLRCVGSEIPKSFECAHGTTSTSQTHERISCGNMEM